jgi:hypothetical protein
MTRSTAISGHGASMLVQTKPTVNIEACIDIIKNSIVTLNERNRRIDDSNSDPRDVQVLLDKLVELYDFYSQQLLELQRAGQITKEELFYFEYAISRRIDRLNELLFASKTLTLTEANDGSSVVRLLHSYNQLHGLNREVNERLRSLNTGSIEFIRLRFKHLVFNCIQAKGKFLCVVYQYSANRIHNHVDEHDLREDLVENVLEESSRKVFKSKRSSSADNYNHNNYHRQQQRYRQNQLELCTDEKPNTALQKATSIRRMKPTNGVWLQNNDLFRTHIGGFKFELNEESTLVTDLGHSIKLIDNCTQIKIIIYRLISTTDEYVQLKQPLFYGRLDLSKYSTEQSKLCESLEVSLNSICTSCIEYSSKKAFKASTTFNATTNLNVFKRIFKSKSKSTTRYATICKEEKSSVDRNSSNKNCVCLRNTLKQTAVVSILISSSTTQLLMISDTLSQTDTFELESWRLLWHPAISLNSQQPSSYFIGTHESEWDEFFEKVTITLHKLELTSAIVQAAIQEPNHNSRSRNRTCKDNLLPAIVTQSDLINHEASFYFIRIEIDSSSGRNARFHDQDWRICQIQDNSDQTKASSKSFYNSRMFKIGENINDISQILISFERIDSESSNVLSLKINLCKVTTLSDNCLFESIASAALILERGHLRTRRLCLVGESTHLSHLCSFCLSLSYSIQSSYYPTSAISRRLFEHKSLEHEELRELLDVYVKELAARNQDIKTLKYEWRSCSFEILLLSKLLEMLAAANAANSTSSHTNTTSHARAALSTIKIYEAMLNVLKRSVNSSRSLGLSEGGLCSALKRVCSDLGDAQQRRSIVHSLLTVMKRLIEASSLSAATSPSNLLLELFESSMRHMAHLTLLLVELTSSYSTYQLKYEINDLVMRLSNNIGGNHAHMQRLFTTLDLRFVEHLNTSCLFSAYELSNLVNSRLLCRQVSLRLASADAESTSASLLDQQEIVLRWVNEQLFSLNIFASSYEFRERVIECLISNYLRPHPRAFQSTILSPQQVLLISNCMLSQTKLSQQSLNLLLAHTIRPLIATLSELLSNERSEHQCMNELLLRSFLTLVDMITLMVINGTGSACKPITSSILNLDNKDLLRLFVMFSYYSKLNIEQSNEKFDNEESNVLDYKEPLDLDFNMMKPLWWRVNEAITSFGQQVQKHLIRFVIIKYSESSYSSNEHTDTQEQLVILLEKYLQMIFACGGLEKPTTKESVDAVSTISKKIDAIQSIYGFWKRLNVNEKRSIRLGELLINKLISTLFMSFYVRTSDIMSVEPDDCNLHLICDESLQTTFYESYFRLLNEFFSINVNHLFDYEQFEAYFFLQLVNLFIEYQKKKMNDPNGTLYVSRSREALRLIGSCLYKEEKETNNLLTHQNDQQNWKSLFRLLALFADYVQLKEEDILGQTNERASIIEKHIVIYELFKAVDKLKLKRCDSHLIKAGHLIETQSSRLLEIKRQCKLYILDDMHYLYKSERDYLKMSYVRKEQADLLNWNSNSSDSNDRESEAGLRELTYLSSLRSFVLHTLNKKLMRAENADLASLMHQTPVSWSSSSPLECPRNEIANSVENTNSSSSIQFDICKKLSAYYEQCENNVEKLTFIHLTESQLSQLSSSLCCATAVDSSNKLNTKNSERVYVRSYRHSHGHLWFRIGLFGGPLRFNSVRNKYFVYKHSTHEMLSNVQSFILNKLAHAELDSASNSNSSSCKHLLTHNNFILLHHNQTPESKQRDDQINCYIQVCALNKTDTTKLLELIEEMRNAEERADAETDAECERERSSLDEIQRKLSKFNENASFYYFDRPFYLNKASSTTNSSSRNSSSRISLAQPCFLANGVEENGDDCVDRSSIDEIDKPKYQSNNDSVENLWIERTILMLDDEMSARYENIVSFEEVISTHKVMLNPIRNAINDIKDKTKELQEFIVEFATNATATATISGNECSFTLIHSLQPLTMRLLGCLDARVNGGLIKYVKELLLNENNSFCRRAKKSLMHQLYLCIKDQLNVLESGLSIHDRILKSVEIGPKHEQSSSFSGPNHSNVSNSGGGSSGSGSGQSSNNSTASNTLNLNNPKLSESNGPMMNAFNYGNSRPGKYLDMQTLKHMTELNIHLIDCLKLIENELSEKWSILF